MIMPSKKCPDQQPPEAQPVSRHDSPVDPETQWSPDAIGATIEEIYEYIDSAMAIGGMVDRAADGHGQDEDWELRRCMTLLKHLLEQARLYAGAIESACADEARAEAKRREGQS
jgi:hypothetical protein